MKVNSTTNGGGKWEVLGPKKERVLRKRAFWRSSFKKGKGGPKLIKGIKNLTLHDLFSKIRGGFWFFF